MHDHSCWWEVKPLHNNIGIFSKFLKKSNPFLYFLKVKLTIFINRYLGKSAKFPSNQGITGCFI